MAMVVLVAVVGAIGALAFLSKGPPTSNVVLPPGCVKPADGFLIVAAYNGFNDSVDHGVPANSWPVIHVQEGANVTITVCDADNESHGFQVTHYFDGKINTLSPGQVMTVSFVADQPGSFRIYCSILCSVHWAMVSGELVVG